MELIYAILIFFGAMMPSEYNQTSSAQTNGVYTQATYETVLSSNQSAIQFIIDNPDELERIRTIEIDRTED